MEGIRGTVDSRDSTMEARRCFVLFLMLTRAVFGAWKSSKEDRVAARDLRRGVHYHSKRHMLPVAQGAKKRSSSTTKPRELRKKPSGHLTPLEDDDMDNDEVVSVAIGPPPIRPKYDKISWKHPHSKRVNLSKISNNINNSNNNNNNNNFNNNAVNFVKNVLTQLGREFLLNQVNENFVFGQYVGNSMKNLTSEIRLKMQHDILDLIVKYQKLNKSDTSSTGDVKPKVEDTTLKQSPKEITKVEKRVNVVMTNDTEDGWPDFSNLAKIVG